MSTMRTIDPRGGDRHRPSGAPRAHGTEPARRTARRSNADQQIRPATLAQAGRLETGQPRVNARCPQGVMKCTTTKY